MKQRKAIITLLILILAGNLAACSGKKEEVKEKEGTEAQEQKEESEPEEETVKEQSEEKEEPAEEIPANQNLLTGVPDLSEGAIGKRPVAVMVNNVEAALPQYGIGTADIIFEIPVEGDKTRLMAIYGDYTKVPKICSVRSCRGYFPAFSQGFDAFYVNWGIDDTVDDYLEALNMDQIEGITNTGGLFGRDQDRLNKGYALEHTGYFDGTRLVEYLEKEGLRTELAEDKTGTAFYFNGLNEQVKPGEKDCTEVDIDFGAQSAQFHYDEDKKVYLKEIGHQPQIEGTTGEQLAFTNVIILETDIRVRDEIGHKDVNWEGGEGYTGYYISNGGMQTIQWSKDKNNENSYLQLLDKDGKGLKLNRGKIYIAVNYRNQTQVQ